ncbi:MAG: NYN domain-containing protein [Clostridia bacterium]|nr:NYN domain-containing protein [Clostridia bacterium]
MANDDRFALLIDADNVSEKYIGILMDELSNEGVITYKRIYGDWTRPELGSWKRILLDYSITPIQQYGYTTGKNATDSAMIIDAMDILYTGSVDGYCIVSSDSDFTRLAARLRESGMYVIGMGEKKTPKPFISACDKFKYLDILSAAAIKDDEKHSDTRETGNHGGETQASSKTIRKAIIAIVDETSDEEGWAPLSNIGNILLKRFPDFDVRNYGFQKLAKMVKSYNCFEINAVRNKDGNKLVYIRNKD